MTESRTHSGPALADIRADIRRRIAETQDRVRSVGCSCAGCDALVYAAEHDADLVNESLTDAGVKP